MISRTHVRQFLAVVDSGNFTRASNQLNIAQPTLSAGISELERQLGTRLFIRERKRIRLTEAGNRLLPLARSIERDFHAAEVQVASIPVPARPIRLGIFESLSANFLERGLQSYRGTDPVELVEGNAAELVSALNSGGIDLALTNLSRFAPRFECRALFEEAYRLAVPDGHRLATKGTVTASDCADETMIARRSCEFLSQTSQFFTEQGVRPRFSLRSDNEERAMAMVRAGLGITVAPESYAMPGIAMVSLEGLPLHRAIGFALGPHWQGRSAAIDAIVDGFVDKLPNSC